MSMRWLKMGRIGDKMRQDGAKMRKMKDVSSVLGLSGGEEYLQVSNNTASRGAGEVPPLGRVNPSRLHLSNPYRGSSVLKSS